VNGDGEDKNSNRIVDRQAGMRMGTVLVGMGKWWE